MTNNAVTSKKPASQMTEAEQAAELKTLCEEFGRRMFHVAISGGK